MSQDIAKHLPSYFSATAALEFKCVLLSRSPTATALSTTRLSTTTTGRPSPVCEHRKVRRILPMLKPVHKSLNPFAIIRLQKIFASAVVPKIPPTVVPATTRIDPTEDAIHESVDEVLTIMPLYSVPIVGLNEHVPQLLHGTSCSIRGGEHPLRKCLRPPLSFERLCTLC